MAGTAKPDWVVLSPQCSWKILNAGASFQVAQIMSAKNSLSKYRIPPAVLSGTAIAEWGDCIPMFAGQAPVVDGVGTPAVHGTLKLIPGTSRHTL